MSILSNTVGKLCGNQKCDVMLIQAALTILKLYNAPIDGRWSEALGSALIKYATTKRIPLPQTNPATPATPATLRLQPSDKVVKSLATDAEKVASKPPPRAHLNFNGKTLELVQSGSVVQTWKAVSGRPGFQDKIYQTEKSTGPILEGRYLVKQDQMQHFDSLSFIDQIASRAGRGTWPGAERSWGLHRVWIEPMPGTNTYGRGGLTIHGGEEPGSAGCIDLTNKMDSFVNHFMNYG